MKGIWAAALLSIVAGNAAAARLKYRTSSKPVQTVSSRARIHAARKAGPTPVIIQGGPVKGGAVNLPHGRGRRAAFAFEKADPPPPKSALAPLKSIKQEFLERIAAKHTKGVKVKAVKRNRVAQFDADREGDTEVVVIDGSSSPQASAPVLGGGHNRDQGGKPLGKKK